jgi:4-hydroxybenzoyl-CoA reductase subunit beta
MLRLHEYAYHRPHALAEALELKARHGDDALWIAGGTDLVPNMKHGLFAPAHLIALKGVAELRGVRETDGWLEIGAAETLASLARHPALVRRFPSLAQAAGSVAGPQLRAMGTIGGNVCLDTRCTYYNQTHFWRDALGYCLKKDGVVCHVTQVGKKCVAAHSADTPPVLITLGAEVELASPEGTRRVPVEELFIADGIWNSVRRADEIVTTVRVPLAAARYAAGFGKVRQRNAIDFPLLNVAAAAELADDGTISELRMVVSALGARPRVLSGLDRVAHGRVLDEDVIEAVAERAYQQCHPLTNIIVDPDWRRAMVPVQVRRVLRELANGTATRAA